MESLAMRRAIVIALLASAIGILVGADQSIVFVGCNAENYDFGSRFALNVNTVLRYLQKKVLKSELGDTKFHYVRPDVYGYAKCSTYISEEECSSCLKSAVGYMSVNCGTAIGANVTLDNCGIRYETYDF